MSDTATVEQDQPIEESSSILDHAAQFSPQARQEAVDEGDGADPLKPIRPVDQQRRDQGKFAPGRQRMRSKDAVTRINELTGRAKTAEEERDRLKAEIEQYKSKSAPTGTPSPAPAAPRPPERSAAPAAASAASAPGASTFSEPEPDENDPKFAGDYAKYLRAAAAWEGRKAYWEAQQEERTKAEAAKQEETQREALTSWASRVTDAKTRYQDFEQVAFGTELPIPQDSVIDKWIMRHKTGPDVLYYLAKNRQELDALLRMDDLEQSERLALLSQRFSASQQNQPSQGETTGSPGRLKQVVLPPKPPNPVRTEAQRASDGPPPTDGSLSIMQHAKHYRRA